MKNNPQKHQNGPEKTDLFDRIAEAFGFDSTDTGRKPRFRYDELAVLYDRLDDLERISMPRDGSEVRADLRERIGNAVGFEGRRGRPLTKEEVAELVGVLLDDDVVPDGGSATAIHKPAPGESYPTDRDLRRAEEEGYVYEWTDPAECVCVSKHQNSTRFHTLWTVRDGELVPACRGYSPSNDTDHRLAPETSIARTKDECDYCQNEDLRL